MPADFPKSGRLESFFMDWDIEKVIFNLEGTAFQKKGPSNPCTLGQVAGEASIKTVFAKGGGRGGSPKLDYNWP